jgi:hypothetical protein
MAKVLNARRESLHEEHRTSASWCNVGPKERIMRLTVGLAAAVGIFFPLSTGFRVFLGVVAVAGLFTAISRCCPLNHLLRIDNCRR